MSQTALDQAVIFEHKSAPVSIRDGFIVLHAYPDPPLEKRWIDCLAHAHSPAHFASPAFFLEPYFREKRPFAILSLEDDNVTAVLTGLHQADTVLSGLETRVHIALDERHDAERALTRLLRGVEAESRGANLVTVYSWKNVAPQPFLASGFRIREFMGNPVLDLSLGPETLLKKCNPKRRNNIRFAIKSGVEIAEAETKEEFEAFYAIYAQWCKAKQIFQYSEEIEWEAFQTTRNNRRLLLARYQGQIIAGSFFRFFPGGLVEYSRNSSLPEHLRLKPNDLLVWRAIEWACENGFTHFSMGGNHRFLREFGGQIVPIVRYRKDRTLFRRHDLAEVTADAVRATLGKIPKKYVDWLRALLRREKPAGW